MCSSVLCCTGLGCAVRCGAFTCRFDYSVDERRAEWFFGEIRKYFPALPDNALQADYSGIRPKIYGQGQPAADFMIQVQYSTILMSLHEYLMSTSSIFIAHSVKGSPRACLLGYMCHAVENRD